jgi:hypothetical protein
VLVDADGAATDGVEAVVLDDDVVARICDRYPRRLEAAEVVAAELRTRAVGRDDGPRTALLLLI